MAQELCPRCQLPRDQWKGNGGEGVEEGGETYCCAGCAYNTGCVCIGEDQAAGRRPA